MSENKKHTYIAYRCPECGDLTVGLVGEFALTANMMRLKCTCGGSALVISPEAGGKLKISVPCVLCKDDHTFVLSSSMFFDRDIFRFNCPYANLDIAFIGTKEKVDEAADASAEALSRLIASIGAEDLPDIQPMDVNEEDALPDAAVYDIIRFVVKDLEAEGNIDCPCHSGSYELRYAPGGLEAYCHDCGATYLFKCASPTMAEEYLTVDSVRLS